MKSNLHIWTLPPLPDAQIEETEKPELYLLLINQTIVNRIHVIVDKLHHLLVRVKKSLYHQEPSFFFNTPHAQHIQCYFMKVLSIVYFIKKNIIEFIKSVLKYNKMMWLTFSSDT